ncbi:sulfotransferase family protein [Roseibium hamelinense]|uniref:Sulfotransferase family protein n=1 Tax=Roseibium hamelinense TaxID=150831 RepID=A0A562THP2_9HYPH|nr:sulfotransferase family 2 domain-containing protein [Roseibium hamelinense]MTI45656.1 hypothetical protein [Roseibium hamelinense]TWI93161.1 sulfotransferase family protein [Roseibium hamelinense]
MLRTLYNLFDRKKRPLRQHSFIVFRDKGLAFGRVPGDPFLWALPVISALDSKSAAASPPKFRDTSCPPVWQSDIELLTARELKRRYPDMPVFACVQSPIERVVSCYENVILGDMPLTAYFAEKRFSKDMSITAFAAKVANLPDMNADNLLRNQTSILNHRKQLVPDLLVDIDSPDQQAGALSRLLKAHGVKMPALKRISYSARHNVLTDELLDSSAARLVRKRYARDAELFNMPLYASGATPKPLSSRPVMTNAVQADSAPRL